MKISFFGAFKNVNSPLFANHNLKNGISVYHPRTGATVFHGNIRKKSTTISNICFGNISVIYENTESKPKILEIQPNIDFSNLSVFVIKKNGMVGRLTSDLFLTARAAN